MSKDRIQLSDHFTTGRLLRFVASPIIMMIFTSVYTVVDGFFISNFAGKTAFSALNLIYPFLQAFGCLGFMVGTGGSALVAMTLGTGDKKQADNLFSMLAASTIVMGIVSTIIGWFLLEPAAQLLGATPELLPDCLMYGRILLVFQTAFMMQFFFQSFFITSEKPKLGLAFTVLAGLTNIVLDFLLVGVLRGSIVGAASATVISQMVGGIGPMFYFFNRKNSSLLHFVRPKFSAKALGKACANGSSELMTNLSASLVSALYNLQLMKLIGADGVAAYGVLMYVGFIFAAVFNAFNARTEKINLFENITGNKGFLKIIGLIAVVQIIMTYLGGHVLRCHGLDFVEWLVILAMSISIIPIDLIRKTIFKPKE